MLFIHILEYNSILQWKLKKTKKKQQKTKKEIVSLLSCLATEKN